MLVAGAGLAGLYAALRAARRGASVVLVTKGTLRASNSFFAQGGIAAAVGPDDSPARHAADTERAGRGLCDPAAVAVLVREGIARVEELERLGVRFDRAASGERALGREGGHSRRRILHAGGSATGAAIAEALIARVAETPAIRVLEHTAVVSLVAQEGRCAGAWVLGHDELRPLRAGATLLATGGAAGLFARTTNPPGALGEGVALAHRAGATVLDMEFVQFHPTALDAGGRAFLVSEAVRGEGAHLVDAQGRRFMPALHPDAELAPRDVVARAIHERSVRGERSFLSLAHLDPEHLRRRFANLVAGCAEQGFDLATDLVPVAPAAHYVMGGVATGLDGATSLDGLYAAGECASSGVHGANRLASNSLLECFVFAHRAVEAGLDAPVAGLAPEPPPAPVAGTPLGELRARMWRHAGPARDGAGLASLLDWLATRPPSNAVLTASLIASAALARTETRGAHVRTDHPEPDCGLARRLPCPPILSPA